MTKDTYFTLRRTYSDGESEIREEWELGLSTKGRYFLEHRKNGERVYREQGDELQNSAGDWLEELEEFANQQYQVSSGAEEEPETCVLKGDDEKEDVEVFYNNGVRAELPSIKDPLQYELEIEMLGLKPEHLESANYPQIRLNRVQTSFDSGNGESRQFNASWQGMDGKSNMFGFTGMLGIETERIKRARRSLDALERIDPRYRPEGGEASHLWEDLTERQLELIGSVDDPVELYQEIANGEYDPKESPGYIDLEELLDMHREPGSDRKTEFKVADTLMDALGRDPSETLLEEAYIKMKNKENSSEAGRTGKSAGASRKKSLGDFHEENLEEDSQ